MRPCAAVPLHPSGGDRRARPPRSTRRRRKKGRDASQPSSQRQVTARETDGTPRYPKAIILIAFGTREFCVGTSKVPVPCATYRHAQDRQAQSTHSRKVHALAQGPRSQAVDQPICVRAEGQGVGWKRVWGWWSGGGLVGGIKPNFRQLGKGAPLKGTAV
jgi:hypothetical protein